MLVEVTMLDGSVLPVEVFPMPGPTPCYQHFRPMIPLTVLNAKLLKVPWDN